MIRKPTVLVLLTSGLALSVAACGGTCEEEGTCAEPATSASSGDTSSPGTSASATSTATGTSATTTSGEVTGPEVEVLIRPSKMAGEELYASDGRYNIALGPLQVADMMCDPDDFAPLNQEVASDAGDAGGSSSTSTAVTGDDAGASAADAALAPADAGATSGSEVNQDASSAEAGVCATLDTIAGVVTDQGSIGSSPQVPGYAFEESCLRVDVPFRAIGDFFEFQWIQSFDATGYDLFVPVKLISVEGEPDAACRVGMKFYIKAGADWTYGSAGWTATEPYEDTGIGTWSLLHINTEFPEDYESADEYPADQVKSVGVGFDSACNAADEDTVAPLTYSFCVGEVVKVLR